MSDPTFKANRESLAWELLAEGCTTTDFDLLEIMVLREEHPGLAREADTNLDALVGEFDRANLVAAIDLAERRYRRALRAERRGNETVSDGGSNAIAKRITELLDRRAPIAAWGIARLMRV